MFDNEKSKFSESWSLPPEQIEARSFEIIAKLLPEVSHTDHSWPVISRIVHATGDPSIASLVRIHPEAIEAGVNALRAGCPIVADVGMVAAGISRRLADNLGCRLICAIDSPGVAEMARKEGITRSAAAVRALSSILQGAVVAIGNAPTALFALLDAIDGRQPVPALIVGTPVGFVGAAESKGELVRRCESGPPYITVAGTRGGSAVAAAAVNALLRLAAGKDGL